LLRLVVQTFGLQLFNDGLRQTLRLSYQEYENRSSGETVAMLQKVRNDTEKFINGVVNILFSSVVGIAFLIWCMQSQRTGCCCPCLASASWCWAD
jgi:ATP-binding cassette subfamily B protein